MLANIGIDFVVFSNAIILRGHWLFSVDWQPYHGHLNFALLVLSALSYVFAVVYFTSLLYSRFVIDYLYSFLFP